jgi:hypothetical protein
MRVLLDCYNLKFFRVGAGGYRLSLSPGSKMNDLEESHSGHLMLPCTRFPKPFPQQTDKKVSFVNEKPEEFIYDDQQATMSVTADQQASTSSMMARPPFL